GHHGDHGGSRPGAWHRPQHALSQTQALWPLMPQRQPNQPWQARCLPHRDLIMTLTLRSRILFTLLPLLALLALLGGTAVVLLRQLGERVNSILRENYDSVIYMERLKEALQRIDSSYTFALLGHEDKARSQFQEHWQPF